MRKDIIDLVDSIDWLRVENNRMLIVFKSQKFMGVIPNMAGGNSIDFPLVKRNDIKMSYDNMSPTMLFQIGTILEGYTRLKGTYPYDGMMLVDFIMQNINSSPSEFCLHGTPFELHPFFPNRIKLIDCLNFCDLPVEKGVHIDGLRDHLTNTIFDEKYQIAKSVSICTSLKVVNCVIFASVNSSKTKLRTIDNKWISTGITVGNNDFEENIKDLVFFDNGYEFDSCGITERLAEIVMYGSDGRKYFHRNL